MSPAQPVFEGLADKVAPAHTAVVVVDVQNDFCAPGGMMHREGLDLSMVQDTVPRIHDLILASRKVGAYLIFIQSHYGIAGGPYLSSAWLEQAGRRRAGSYTRDAVCTPGSWNADFFDPVRPAQGEVVVHKHRFSPFQGTNLELILRSQEIRTVVLAGVATNVCVETAARDAFVRDFHVVLVEDCAATYSQAEQEGTLRTIDRYFGEVVDLPTLAACWDT